MENIRNVVYSKNRVGRFIIFIFGLLILSISYNVFSRRCNLIYGMSGIGLLINHKFGIDPSLVILTGNVILLILSYFMLGKEKTANTLLGSLLFPVFVKMTEPIGIVDLGELENILITVCGAILSGIGVGLVFKAGYTSGGTDILNQIFSKYGKISMGKAMYFTDLIIIFFAVYVFNFQTFIYSVINMYIISLITDKVILGISNSKAFYIITEHETDIKKFITQNLSHDVTVLEARGGYTGNMEKVIMCIVPTKEYFLFKEGIEMIDKDAFFIVTDAYETSGGL